MTSFGRGRGWSSQNQSQDKDQGLRRPGGSTSSNNKVLKDIIEKITLYNENEDSLIEDIMKLLIIVIKEDNLRSVCDSLWKQAIYHSLTTKIAIIFSSVPIIRLEDNNENSIRSLFLRFLQDNYISKQKDRAEDQRAFANKALLHADVYYHMKLSNGNRLKVLAEPLIQYMEDLLQDNPKDNIYFVMKQILRSGKDLYAVCPNGLENLIMTIRQLIIDENFPKLSPENYAALLLIVELANNDYEIKDTRLINFYFSNIKSLSFESPSSQKQLKMIVTTKTENDNQLWEVENNQQIVKEEVKNDVPEHGNYAKNTNVPRAIRGSGALDKPKKGTDINAKSNSLKTTLPRERNKAWGHDDRFHEHYE
ncbi:PREDICTED: uncharacterized protein LOC108777428 [Cyphomyrmex costatus]|uniref:CBP80/20-dependent translation initiation factor n=1 Tax=Cyphomyrmex costatus TaxID=456900 RepID=A0A195CDA9_9HYME|nr:PREDICTED: uncharacterized protein LOC108777428 [Cyphomyrmex costatus]XP_018399816.1 PREDICTED: uncharacterized protein LOC108777428 [Cyphomyrmex costatus]XP_018399817.1 PREDICTED: uncharacterized protein LOC108777428 [Cyphomyrmex costatus]XP_018399818.1 PREDICTED: uncharacterized protein LOC108777428 [Cyphomyrmex costatus]KYM98695.1 hypothetical protein ALC62_10663 [Cyphomyrmex costatus]